MAFYELDQSVIADVLALVSAPTLQIAASQAPRVAQLQMVLAQLQPSDAVEVARREATTFRQQRDVALDSVAKLRASLVEQRAACASARDVAVALEQELAAERSKQQLCFDCGHRAVDHTERMGCTLVECKCTAHFDQATGEPVS